MNGKEIVLNTYDTCIIYPDTKKPETPVKSQVLKNVKNIHVEHKSDIPININSPIEYTYPTIKIEFMNGEIKKYKESRVDDIINDTPDIDVYLINKCSKSCEKHSIEKYSAWAIWEETYSTINSKENKCVKMRIPSRCGHTVINFGPTHRGSMAKFPDGEIRTYGKFERHSLSYKRNYSREYTPPVTPEPNTFTISTSKGTICNVINVRVNKNHTYAVQTKNGQCIFVKDIYDSRGGKYTICIKQKSDNTYYDVKTTTYKKHVGVYETDNEYVFVGNPIRAGVHKAPSKYTITKDSVIDMHIKKPNGDIINSIPEYAMYGEQDIPNLQESHVPDIDIDDTDISKENLKIIISARLYGDLEPLNVQDSDFSHIIEVYPKIEKLIKYISTYNKFTNISDQLPYEYTKEELNTIRRYSKYKNYSDIKKDKKLTI